MGEASRGRPPQWKALAPSCVCTTQTWPGGPAPQVNVHTSSQNPQPSLDATWHPHEHHPRDLIRNSSLSFPSFPGAESTCWPGAVNTQT